MPTTYPHDSDQRESSKLHDQQYFRQARARPGFPQGMFTT